MDLSQQADDVLDLYDWLDIQKCTHTQQIGEYDWSSGHSKAQGGGLNPLAFNKGAGGKQTEMRPPHLDHPSCVGKEEAVLYRSKEDINLWSRMPMAGYQEIDCRVYEGDTHHSVFRDGDPPPFLDLKRRPNEDWISKRCDGARGVPGDIAQPTKRGQEQDRTSRSRSL